MTIIIYYYHFLFIQPNLVGICFVTDFTSKNKCISDPAIQMDQIAPHVYVKLVVR